MKCPFISNVQVSKGVAYVQCVRPAGGFRREVQPRRQHWFLNEKSGFPFRTPAFCSVSRGQRRLGEEEYRAPSVTPGVALRPRTQGMRFITPTLPKIAAPVGGLGLARWAKPWFIAEPAPSDRSARIAGQRR